MSNVNNTAAASFVFVISSVRANAKSGATQIRCKEYLNKGGEIKSLATMHSDFNFISGLHHCLVNNVTGERRFSVDQNRTNPLSVKINLPAQMVKTVIAQVDSINAEKNNALAKPPRNMDKGGISELKSYQLIVRLFSPKGRVAFDADMNSDVLYISEDKVHSIEIVDASSPEFVVKGVEMDVFLAMDAFGAVKDTAITKEPETVEEAKAIIEAARSYAKNRRPTKSRKRERNAATSTSVEAITTENASAPQLATTPIVADNVDDSVNYSDDELDLDLD